MVIDRIRRALRFACRTQPRALLRSLSRPLLHLGLGASIALAWQTGRAAEPVLSEGQAERGRIVEMLDPQARPVTRGFQVRPSAAGPSASIMVTFETASARLSGEAQRALDEMAAAMNHPRLRDQRFLIEGHADPRGSSDYNLALSRDRAQAVRRYLVEQGDVDRARLEVVGRGDAEPVNRENVAAPENRRVRFVRLQSNR